MCHFMNKLGRCFQIRDDYQNLASQEYTSQRGFCQDLDEMKPSFPFIRACHELQDSTTLTEWFKMPRNGAGASVEVKRYILSQIQGSGSFEYTKELISHLLSDLEDMLRDMESVTGQKNWILRNILVQLRVKEERAVQKKETTVDEVMRVWGQYQETAWTSSLS